MNEDDPTEEAKSMGQSMLMADFLVTYERTVTIIMKNTTLKIHDTSWSHVKADSYYTGHPQGENFLKRQN